MEDRPHKSHRPSQTGAKAEKKADKGKGKEKHGFNEKVVRSIFLNDSHVIISIGLRPKIWSPGR